MFANAKKVTTLKAPAKGKPKKAVDTIAGLQEVAAIDAAIKALTGILAVKKAALKETATEILIARGLDKGSRPDSLSLAEGAYATGRAAITKRSTASPLSADELEMLAEATGADVTRDDDGAITAIDGFAETLESMPAMLAVNPTYAGDEALLKKIDKALSGVKGIPADFIIQTEARAKVVTSETAPDKVFKLGAAEAETAFPLIAGVSLGAVFKDMEAAWQVVKPLLAPTKEEASKELMGQLKASLKKAS